MDRREFLKHTAAASAFAWGCRPSSGVRTATSAPPRRRVRPGDPGWPSEATWAGLNDAVGGRLVQIDPPLAACRPPAAGADSAVAGPDSGACNALLGRLSSPFAIGDDPALTQSTGWVDAWTSQPSAYAIAARETADVVAGVNFAREHDLRLVVKGGGHSYQGRSNAPDSLLIWTRHMDDVALHDAFVPAGCEGRVGPQPAVTVGAGTIWGRVYDAVTTRGGRYVQGGGCTTVGVAGLIQSGGFGSWSKNYGLAAAGLLEAEVVTADGNVRIANACTNPDLFWGLKGGGGGSLGVVTRLTLRTRGLPEFFGGTFGRVRATSDAAYRALIAGAVDLYAERLSNPHWGEQLSFVGGDTLRVSMAFQGLDQAAATAAWQPFTDWLAAAPDDYVVEEPVGCVAIPARHLWDPDFLEQVAPGLITRDGRPGARTRDYSWAGDTGQAGQFHHGYRSAWIPASLLDAGRRGELVDALFAAARQWTVSLHVNKGLAGAPEAEIAAARDTAMNPDVLGAFALAILGAEGPAVLPGVPGHEADLDRARRRAASIDRAMDTLLAVAPGAGSYLSESNYFEPDWQRSFWGTNYPRLAEVKRKYDPDGLFFIHHGVGSEGWSDDGFTRKDGESGGA